MNRPPEDGRTTPTSLTAPTEEMRERLRTEYGADTIAKADRSGDELAQIDFARHAPQVGEQAPDFRLPDSQGGSLALGEILARGPAVVVFYRGGWCPYCNLQLAAFQARLDEIEAAGATLVAISPQTPDASLSLAERRELRFAVLSDTGNGVARRYGLEYVNPEWHVSFQSEHGVNVAEFNGEDSQRLPAAATFVVARDGTVAYASVSADYRWRVGPEEVLAALQALAAPLSSSRDRR